MRRQLPLNVANWTADVMQLTIKAMQINAAALESDSAPTTIPKIQTGLAYYEWKESMNNYLDQQRALEVRHCVT